MGTTRPRTEIRFDGWKRRATIASIGALVAFVVMGGMVGARPWVDRGRLFVICLVYASFAAFAAPFIRPPFIKRLAARNRMSWWLAQAAMLPLLCFVAGGLAMMVLLPLGLVGMRNAPTFLYPWAMSGSALGALAVIFLAVSTYEVLRARIDSTTLALRTKERDEADAQRLAAEARLSALESKVNPHFLFNTLNSIASLIASDPASAERMTGRLATLMRSSLDASSAPVTSLEDEISLVRAYLEIQRVRFGDRLRYSIDVPDTLASLHVPRLSIQTLVENSVKYAVSPRREGATIRVTAEALGPVARLTVEDDGPGFNPTSSLVNHGLELLRSRLALAFENAARLTITSNERGTQVVLELPAS